MSTDTPTDEPLWPAGYERIILDKTDSTMKEAARRAPELAAPTWILARRQTQAHGRRGRPWKDLGDNFAATLVFHPDGPMRDAALRSFTAAVALYFTLSTWVSSERLTLKWPNDVLLDGGKVAGILLEGSQQAGRTRLAIGIGVNLARAPDAKDVEADALPPVSLAAATGKTHDPIDFLTLLALHFAQHERIFQDLGFDPIRRLWLRHAARLGEPITARTVTETHHGTFDTVDMTGALVLNTAKGRVAIPAADVYF